MVFYLKCGIINVGRSEVISILNCYLSVIIDVVLVCIFLDYVFVMMVILILNLLLIFILIKKCRINNC